MNRINSNVDILGVEQAAAKTWEQDASVRVEFGGNRDAWMAYSRANAQGMARDWAMPGDKRTGAALDTPVRPPSVTATTAQHARRMWDTVPAIRAEFGTYEIFATRAGVGL